MSSRPTAIPATSSGTRVASSTAVESADIISHPQTEEPESRCDSGQHDDHMDGMANDYSEQPEGPFVFDEASDDVPSSYAMLCVCTPSPPPPLVRSALYGITTPPPVLSNMATAGVVSTATNPQADGLAADLNRLCLQLGTHSGMVAEICEAQQGYHDLHAHHMKLQKDFKAFCGATEGHFTAHEESLDRLRDVLSHLGTELHSDISDLSSKMTSRIDKLRDMLQDSSKAPWSVLILPTLFAQSIHLSYNSAASIQWGSSLGKFVGGSSHSAPAPNSNAG